MTNRACLVLCCLIVEIGRSRSRTKGGSGVTLQTQNIQVAGLDQARIRRSMWRVAGYATLSLDRQVLENERSLFIRVAGVADRIPRGCRAKLLADEPTMGIMTIGTLNEPFFHPMVERHVELRLDLLVAGIAEIRLSFDQKVLVRHSVVGRMAIQTAQIILAMCRAGKIHVVFARAVTFQTALVDFFWRCSLEAEDLFGIAWVVDMTSSRPVASFASLLGWAATLVERGFPVRRFVKIVVDILVASLASFRASIG